MTVLSRVDDATEIPDVVERAINWKQFLTFSDYVKDLCRNGELEDKSLMKVNAKGSKVSNINQGKLLRCGVWDGDEKNMESFFAEANMGDIVESVLKPLTKGPASSGKFPMGCSYVEIVSTERQAPEIFVSHYWGQPFSVFSAALQGYLKRKGVNSEARVWICSLAHRQWCIEQELGTNSDAFPFARVINHPTTHTTVLVTSGDCGAMRRLWCLAEASKAIQKRRHGFDIVVGSAGSTNVKMICTTEANNPDAKLMEDDLWDKLTEIYVESAGVSKFADKHLLMSQIQKSGIQVFNATIKKRIGQNAFGLKVSRGDIEFVKGMLASQFDVNAFDVTSNEGSPLHMAVAASNTEMATLLLNSKADFNDQRNPSRQTPLHKAQNAKVMKFLLDLGADAERKNAAGEVPEKHAAPIVEDAPAISNNAAGKQEDLPVALPNDESEKENQPEETGFIYDELLSLLMTERPISTKVDWKFSGKIRLPRQSREVTAQDGGDIAKLEAHDSQVSKQPQDAASDMLQKMAARREKVEADSGQVSSDGKRILTR